ncbi:unnamed protein product [Pleuronectes platessa]|uniref:Uncharacterized protein n=1 Tax=Pleuronectes platessa TaxID=8262 RepID=A0A9N7YES2_PLEPL|nr:unnamed protein product [Pleuronectes platessa]
MSAGKLGKRDKSVEWFEFGFRRIPPKPGMRRGGCWGHGLFERVLIERIIWTRSLLFTSGPRRDGLRETLGLTVSTMLHCADTSFFSKDSAPSVVAGGVLIKVLCRAAFLSLPPRATLSAAPIPHCNPQTTSALLLLIIGGLLTANSISHGVTQIFGALGLPRGLVVASANRKPCVSKMDASVQEKLGGEEKTPLPDVLISLLNEEINILG